MSSSNYRNQQTALQKDKARLESDLARARDELARLQKGANDLAIGVSTTKSAATRRSKQQQLTTKQGQIAQAQKKIADIEKKISDKVTAINRNAKNLADAESRETKQRQQAEIRHMREINDEIEQQAALETSLQQVRQKQNKVGQPLKISGDARDTAKILLDMLESKEIEKESRLSNIETFGGRKIQLVSPDRQLKDFLVPIADIKELDANGILSLQPIIRSGRLAGWDMLLLPERLRDVISGQTRPDVFNIFYSWQSWTPGNVNRHFILGALESAAKSIRNDGSLEVEPVVDRDTLGMPGAVDIAATIYEKIRASQIFVCDTTIVTDPEATRPIPNPNVMLELGYAAAILGWERIICVANTAFGTVETMPFDLRPRRLLPYNLSVDLQEKASLRRQLEKSIREALTVIIDDINEESD